MADTPSPSPRPPLTETVCMPDFIDPTDPVQLGLGVLLTAVLVSPGTWVKARRAFLVVLVVLAVIGYLQHGS